MSIFHHIIYIRALLCFLEWATSQRHCFSLHWEWVRPSLSFPLDMMKQSLTDVFELSEVMRGELFWGREGIWAWEFFWHTRVGERGAEHEWESWDICLKEHGHCRCWVRHEMKTCWQEVAQHVVIRHIIRAWDEKTATWEHTTERCLFTFIPLSLTKLPVFRKCLFLSRIISSLRAFSSHEELPSFRLFLPSSSRDYMSMSYFEWCSYAWHTIARISDNTCLPNIENRSFQLHAIHAMLLLNVWVFPSIICHAMLWENEHRC